MDSVFSDKMCLLSNSTEGFFFFNLIEVSFTLHWMLEQAVIIIRCISQMGNV